MPATVAPAKYIHSFTVEFAKRRRATAALFACKASLFDSAHFVRQSRRFSVVSPTVVSPTDDDDKRT
jgi:hypothetical protein